MCGMSIAKTKQMFYNANCDSIFSVLSHKDAVSCISLVSDVIIALAAEVDITGRIL